jgi:hypothetical protein
MLRSWVAAQEELNAIVSARMASHSCSFRLPGRSRLLERTPAAPEAR